MGACALVLLILPAAAQSQSDRQSGAQLARHVSTMKKDRQVVRFFQTHSFLLRDPHFAAEAKKQVAFHTRRLEESSRRSKARRLASVAAAKPRNVICRVFGDYCKEALAVSHCESRFDTRARNGQYLGLFQMGSNERRLFGHGESAPEQVKAAHRYFVVSGRDWSPWSCKPWN